MTAGCTRCANLDAERADHLAELEVIGGSPYPFSSPWGELRRCRGCGACFGFTRDHDSELGYGPDVATLTRLDPARARTLAAEALAVAERQRAYFAGEPGDRAAGVTAAYVAELARLAAFLAHLPEEPGPGGAPPT